MRRPITSTYRLQLRGPHADPQGREFGFAQAADLVPYLRDMGVSHIYLSPVFASARESNHNYDVTDPTLVNPELGGIDGLRLLARAAHEAGMGLVVDIVPNHLGVEVPRNNRWWWDVLKHGQKSQYASYFDVDWHEDNGAGGKLGLPVLGSPEDATQLQLVHLKADEFPPGHAPEGEDVLAYFGHYFPLAPGSYSGLDDDPVAVHERQAYRLMYWRDGVISYRRFFSVNGLAGVRQEDPEVFAATHEGLAQLVREQLIDGVRVDHPDGLTDPFGYLTQLRELIGPECWLIVEKILAVDEPLDPRLDIDGTTGYDALREFDGVFVDASAPAQLAETAYRYSGSIWDEHAIKVSEWMLKARVAEDELAAEVRRLARAVRRDNLSTAGLKVSDADLTEVLVELVARMPVYRADYRSLSRVTATLIAEMAASPLAFNPAALDLVAAALSAGGEAAHRFAQVCGAVMAKGVEDTLFYMASRLVALQEVGGAPGRLGVSPAEFHLLQDERARLWPHAMTTLSTHDTKRSEDTRARMIEIAELPGEFAQLVSDVFALTPPPDPATGHFLIQNVLGAWPRNGEVTQDFVARLQAYAVKAVREADMHTSWYDNDLEYEAEVTKWIAHLADGPATAALAEFARALDRGGVVVSLGRKLLQLVGPGIPDTYQGTEFLDFSLVDPDNRRFVDYAARREALAGDAFADADSAKQHIVREALTLRRERPELFLEGGYQAVFAEGTAARHVIGMARTAGADDADTVEVIALAVREPLALERGGGWRGTTVRLPEGEWVDCLTERRYGGQVDVDKLMHKLPAVLLVRA
ncbi:malto-oligosyltrehalose synthase [Corynebacterium sp. Marseille-P4321]|uniref:malto-oligosyltrehalose synthase n=1 Tax=Corynebacterium sp. Marseille-P4321 TaxID=2736603 RepID=UPI00158CC17F|nr:malto-oligosyltrehalose synthase [Corynebacterium sp. Marseille-P4321]